MANDDSLVRAAADHRHGRTIRLLWLIDSLTLGGAEALVVPFARRAAGSGFDLTVCARKTIAGNPLEPEIRASGAALVNLEAGTLRDLGAFRRLLDVLRRHGTELIHAHLTYAAIWGALAARRTGVPLVASLHVSPAGAVVWTGFRRDVGRRLSAADLFVLPTLRDAFPTVVLEAMAAGKPVVATAVGGIPEIYEDVLTRGDGDRVA
ncbi:MAG TPA: glycosyltransferase [Thermoanaerobaculia bacterium]|nr:glycosyltransferase [Thermoanaerobaculia bacterium]